MTNSSSPLQAVEVSAYPIFTVRWLAVHAWLSQQYFSWALLQQCSSSVV